MSRYESEVSTRSASSPAQIPKSGTTYESWRHMHARCLNPRNHAYARYGGRGIKVCDRWLAFENFIRDMGERPEGMSLDRINNDGNYEPNNCRWANATDQQRNRRSSRVIYAFGEHKLLCEWADDPRCAVNVHAIKSRLSCGWNPEDAITRPYTKAPPRRNGGVR